MYRLCIGYDPILARKGAESRNAFIEKHRKKNKKIKAKKRAGGNLRVEALGLGLSLETGLCCRHEYADTRTCSYTDRHVDMCVDKRVDRCIDRCVAMCVDMCVDV